MNHELASDQAQAQPVVKQEVPTGDSIGVVVVVVAGESIGTGELAIRTITELQDKQTTERRVGQISLPAETRKLAESETDNLLGALAELTNSDEVLARLRVVKDRYYSRAPILVGGKPADVALMIYDGPIEGEFDPVDQAEVRSNGWMPMGDLQRMNGEVRRAAHDSIEYVRAELLAGLTVDYHDRTVPFVQLLESGFSMKEFIQRREEKRDIELA